MTRRTSRSVDVHLHVSPTCRTQLVQGGIRRTLAVCELIFSFFAGSEDSTVRCMWCLSRASAERNAARMSSTERRVTSRGLRRGPTGFACPTAVGIACRERTPASLTMAKLQFHASSLLVRRFLRVSSKRKFGSTHLRNIRLTTARPAAVPRLCTLHRHSAATTNPAWLSSAEITRSCRRRRQGRRDIIPGSDFLRKPS